jgi:type I restriction enzyme, S subunit
VRSNTTPLVPIGDLATSERGAFKIGPFGSSLKKSELVDHGVPVLGIENVLANRMIWTLRRFVSPEKYEQLADYAVRSGDILITTMGTIGRAAVVPDREITAIIDSHLFRMRVNSQRILPRYLAYALNSDDLTRQLERKSRGAIMDGLNTTILKECVLRVPPIRHQERVLAALDTTSNVIRMRRLGLEMSEGLLGGVFLEMFGDPIKNPKGYPISPLADLIEPDRPITYGILKPGPNIPNGIPYIRVTDMVDGRVLVAQVKRTTTTIAHEYRRSRLKAADLLMSIRGHVGRFAVVPFILEGANITQDTARLAPIKAMSSRYLKGCLESPGMQERMSRLTRGVAVTGINLGDVKELPIPVAPLPMQERFASIAEKHESLRATQYEALRQAEHLFQTLLHEAFGEAT